MKIVHDSVQVIDSVRSEQSSSEELKIRRIEEQMKKILENISHDTLFIALSDRASNNFGGKNENVNTCFSDKPCAPFLFAYSKGGFTEHKDLLKEINRDVVKQQNTVHESQIASTIANLMGLPIPYANSGRTLFDVYPANLNEQSFLKRLLHDSYTTMMQQFQLLTQLHKKYNLMTPLKVRQFGEKVEQIRLSIPQQSFEKDKIIPQIQNIITVQEDLNKSIYQILFPYNMTLIYIGYSILFLSILMAICLIVSSSNDNKKDRAIYKLEYSHNSSVTDDSSRDYDIEVGSNKKGKPTNNEDQTLLSHQEEQSQSSTIDFFFNVTILGQNFLYFHDSWNYQLSYQNYTSNQATCIVIMSAELFLYFIYQMVKRSNVQSLWVPIAACLLIAIIKFLFVNRYIFQSTLPFVPYSEIAYPIIYFIIVYIANAFAQVQYSSKKYARLLALLNVTSIIILLLQDPQFNLINPQYNRIIFSAFGIVNLLICYLIKKMNNQTNLFLLINQQLGLVQLYIAIFDSSEITEYLGLVDYLITSILIIIVFGLFQLLSKFSIQIFLVFLNTIYVFSSGIVKDSTSDQFNLWKNIYFTLFGIYLLNVQLLLNKEKLQADSLSTYLTKINNSGNYKHESHKYVQVFGYFSIAIMIQLVFFFTSFLFMANKFYFNLHFQTHSVFCNELLASFAAQAVIMIYFIATYKSLLKDKKSKKQQPDNNYEMVQQSPFSNVNSSL